MAGYIRRNGLRQPCAKDCPDRKPGCVADCERWQAYIEQREEMYRQKRMDTITNDVIVDGMRRMGGRP